MLLCAACVFVFSSCSKEEENFDYPMEVLYGTWEGTEMKVKDK